MNPKKLIAAIDTADATAATSWVEALAPHCGLLKFGLEFFAAHGPAGVARAAGGRKIFLDLKLHDIPNTVAAAVRAVKPLGAEMLTVHAAGGPKMLEAAVAAAEGTAILAVTVLTSLEAEDLAATGIPATPSEQVLRLARLALRHGARGLVCSAHEIALLRAEFGPEPLLVVPGIRPACAEWGGQARVMTPEQAVALGADYIVVGRPITQAADPGAEAARIAAAIA